MKSVNEFYDDSQLQMTNSMKAQDKQQRAKAKNEEQRRIYAISILGKRTFNKYYNKGTFAPLPLSGLKLTFEDFYQLNPNNKNIKMLDEDDIEKTKRIINVINSLSDRNIYKVIDNGFTYMLQTQETFKEFDDVIDFFLKINKAYKQVYRKNDKNNDINWNPIKIKFRKYLN